MRKIASGGMAEVFLARQRGLEGFDKLVVLKRILPQLALDADFLRLFQAEARTAAELHHPNIVDVYEVGEDQGTWFIAMEYLHGHDLARVHAAAKLSGHPVPLGPALQMVIDAAQGLHYAHQKKDAAGNPLRIVHRDVSPHNLLVTLDGVTKVVDFGIARAEGQIPVTAPGVVRGKIQYMAPEHLAGERLDGRADLFSLGIVLYEMTTMRRLFENPQGAFAAAAAVAPGGIPPPSTFLPEYPAALEKILMRALAPRADDRYPTCGAFAAALEDFLDENRILHSSAKTARYLRELFGAEDEEGGLPSNRGSVPEGGTAAQGRIDSEESTAWVPPVAPPAPAGRGRAAGGGVVPKAPSEETSLLSAVQGLLQSEAHARRSNLHDPPGALVGRDGDLASIAAQFARGTRLVTLHGAGGVGKTRLALRAASSNAERFAEGGVWFCDVTEALAADGVCFIVGGVLGVPVAGDDAATRLGRAIAARGRILVVLDNFEQAVGAAPATVGRWMALAPDATFLVTSRERLHLPGEAVLDVLPLSVPAGDSRDADSPAVQLFLERARQVRPQGSAEPDLASVARIVVELDGLPLAIELAASRMSVLSPAKLLERLPRRFDLLKGGRDTGSRQSTLQRTLDWSWNLLDPAEKDALAQASVFRGGFSLETAEEVIDLSAHSGVWTLDVLQSLRDKSLLRTVEAAEIPGEVRFALYANIREYAAAQLAGTPGEKPAVERHAEHFARTGLALADGADTHGGLERRRRLALELENVIAALDRSIAVEPPTRASALRASRAARALHPIFLLRGPYDVYIDRLNRVLAAAERVHLDEAEIARALLLRARARRLAGQLAESDEDLAAVSKLASPPGDAGFAAEIL
ncbi:MAG TPA: protein kinase, partial [bacterium]|nr:protein kinase [bacterium]